MVVCRLAGFGACVAGAGDVNNDGFDDIVVGATGYDGDELNDIGRAYLYLGSESGPADTAAWVTEGDQGGAYYGVSVATAGDVANFLRRLVVERPAGLPTEILDSGRCLEPNLRDQSGRPRQPPRRQHHGQRGVHEILPARRPVDTVADILSIAQLRERARRIG